MRTPNRQDWIDAGWKTFSDLSDAEKETFFLGSKAVIAKVYPCACVMFMSDRRGESAKVGIFSCPLELNEKMNFKSQQPAPQLISELFEMRHLRYGHTLRVDFYADAWISAAIHILFPVNLS